MNAKTTMLALTVLFASANFAVAAEPAHTAITVTKLHCAGCAKKIAAQLYTVRGVKEVRVDMKKNTLFVMPASNATPSPRALWVAVENAKYVPIRLACPNGTFTSTPKF